MNKTGLTIRMLTLLKSRGLLSTRELGQLLETNPRNIREYKKELITAGYNVREIRGPGGGYILDESDVLPAKPLSDDMLNALLESREYLNATSDFRFKKEMNGAVDEIMATAKNVRQPRKHLPLMAVELSDQQMEYLRVCERARDNQLQVELTYQSKTDAQPDTFMVDPYEIVHFDKAYYLIAYSHKRKDWRTYRFSEGRMMKVKISDIHFAPDPDFILRDIIGSTSIFKGNMVKYQVRVERSTERFFLELVWGADLRRISEDNYGAIYEFYSDQEMILERQIFSFGSSVEVLAPESFILSYTRKLKEITRMYGK